MKKVIAVMGAIILVLVLTLALSPALAQEEQIPSTKAAAVLNNIDAAPTTWTTVMSTQIKTGNPKDLIMDVSLESALYTTNKIKGNAETETEACVAVKVLVDTEQVGPVIIFNDRLVNLKGDLSHTGDFEGTIDSHWIELYIMTKSANAFNWIAEDVGTGVHTVEVQAMVTTRAEVLSGETGTAASADALIGYGSLVVDEVNLK
jgi:hypothetical protein